MGFPMYEYTPSKNVEVLGDFMRYCREHPEQRFWQALRNWSGFDFIYAYTNGNYHMTKEDTFHWEGKNR